MKKGSMKNLITLTMSVLFAVSMFWIGLFGPLLYMGFLAIWEGSLSGKPEYIAVGVMWLIPWGALLIIGELI